MTTSFFSKIKTTGLYKFFQRKHVQKYIIVISSAIIIGLTFGFTTLKVLNHVGQPKGVDAVSTVKNDEDNHISIDIAQLQAYVIQGGVFSNEENLTQWKKQFREAGFKSIEWKRDDLYYLLLGVGDSEAGLVDLKETLLNAGLDTYVKSWETKKANFSAQQGDSDWINSFISLWEKSITNEHEHNDIFDEWNEFISIVSDTSDNIKQFKEKVNNIITEQPFETEIEKQYVLLEIWHEFEQFILN